MTKYRNAWATRDPDGMWAVIALPVTGRAVRLSVCFSTESSARRYAADVMGEVIA